MYRGAITRRESGAATKNPCISIGRTHTQIRKKNFSSIDESDDNGLLVDIRDAMQKTKGTEKNWQKVHPTAFYAPHLKIRPSIIFGSETHAATPRADRYCPITYCTLRLYVYSIKATRLSLQFRIYKATTYIDYSSCHRTFSSRRYRYIISTPVVNIIIIIIVIVIIRTTRKIFSLGRRIWSAIGRRLRVSQANVNFFNKKKKKRRLPAII